MIEKLNIITALANTGYGIVGQNLCKEFVKQDIDITIYHPKYYKATDCPGLNQYVKDEFDPESPCLNIWHHWDLSFRIGRGSYTALSFFELDALKANSTGSVNCPHNFCVASEWAKSIVDPVRESVVVPMGVDTSIFYPGETSKGDPYKFFTIGKWEKRKGHDLLAKLFCQAFSEDDNVELHLLCNNPYIKPHQVEEWEEHFAESNLADRIFIHAPFKTHQETADWIRDKDCGLFISRAEGWNMGLLESMACGKPVITTDYSSHTQFCTAENSYLVQIDELEAAYDGVWFFGEGNWARLGYSQEEQIITHMRKVYNERPLNEAGVVTANSLTWKACADKLLQIMED